MQNFDSLRGLLASPKRVVVTMHARPDADALGSALALAHFLRKGHHDVQVISPTDFPAFLNHLPGSDAVCAFDERADHPAHAYIQQADLIFCADFGNFSRLEGLRSAIEESEAIKIIIDHHREPPDSRAKIAIWDKGVAATAVLVYQLVMELRPEWMDLDIAKGLYAGILTDTGAFQHPNTTAREHHIAAALIDIGVEPSEMYYAIYGAQQLNRMRYMGFALYKRLTLLADGQAGYIAVSQEDRMRFKLQLGDTEGLVNYILRIKGVKVAALISEHEQYAHISLRSAGQVAVNELAAAHFNGGGHYNAAGGRSKLPFPQALAKMEKVLEAALQ